MDPTRMLHDMCSNVLTNVDIKAIRKHRGLSEQETATNALLENFLLTDIGVEQAMGQLTPEEVITLHLLKVQGKAVSIAFFERLYGPKPDPKRDQRYRHYGTFTQRYQDMLKSVRTSLVRRGLLLMAEETIGVSDTAKMERWRFRLPHQFERFLPPFLPSTIQYNGPGTFNQNLLHDSIQSSDKQRGADINRPLKLKDQTLYVGDFEFRASRLQKWLQDRWRVGIFTSTNSSPIIGAGPNSLSLIDALLYILSQLASDEWIAAHEIESMLYLMSHRVILNGEESPTASELCDGGWKWGQLVRYTNGDNRYYRLAPQMKSTISEMDPADYLIVQDQNWVRFDLKTIPINSLEQIASTSKVIQIEQGMAAQPSLVKIGQLSATAREHLVIQWLQKHLPSYATALKKVEKDWGKQIIHTNLLVAKINDLSLKVAIERAFAKGNMPDIQYLPNDYIAFPRSALPKVEQVVKKAGHVVKTVKA